MVKCHNLTMPLLNEQGPSKGKGGKTISHVRQSSVDQQKSQPKFPRIEDCAHFHYERVDYGSIKISFVEDSVDGLRLNGSLNMEGFNPAFNVRIACKENTWVVRRSLSHFETLDVWLHECVFDRKFSHLPVLNTDELRSKSLDEIYSQLRSYLQNLSGIIDVDGTEGQIFCAPVLHWLETDNLGRNLAPHALGDVADINIPAIAAARVVRRYQACDDDELTLNVGDMVSIIEMGVSGWWRGKQGFKVGSFPSQCVRRINSATDAVATHERTFAAPSYLQSSSEKPIVRKHGKFMEFLRSFLDTRPTKAHLKKKGILRERVFGCDLGELLHRTNEEIPSVVSDCMRFVEKHGIVDGIYRVSGVASHIRHLKYEFDSDRRPDLENAIVDLPKLGDIPGMSRDSNLKCDAHSVAGLCKLYFRELPNPLLTYQLYNRFASAVTDYEAEERLLKVHDVIQQLPPPHYRTLKHLIDHLRFMAERDGRTSMHSRNLAIVWAPNLLRSREIEAGLAAFTEARVQSVVAEFLIVNGDCLFSEKLQTKQYDAENKPLRPRSLMLLPTPKLISLEEAQARSRSGVVTPASQQGTPVADPSYSGVRLRNASSKSSTSEKRKRHKKSASYVTAQHTNSPYPLRSSKKQGHRHAASYSEVLKSVKGQGSSSPSGTPVNLGWKMKLGTLLRRSAVRNQSAMNKSSLRRTQSCDSIIDAPKSTDAFHLQAEFDNPKQKLNRAMSCEEAGTSDRGFAEPQVPRPSRAVEPETLERLKCGDDGTVFSSRPICSSPLCSLDTDLPSVMDEDGLGFDPLSYRSTNVRSFKDQAPPRGKSSNIKDGPVPGLPPLNSSSEEDKERISDSAHAPSFAQSELAGLRSTFRRDLSCSASVSALRFANVSARQINDNSASRDRVGQSNPLDSLTADCIASSHPAPSWRASKRSATERLCVTKDRPRFRETAGFVESESRAAHSDSSDALLGKSRQVSVQVYNVAAHDRPKRTDHYGSFIALIGSDIDDAATSSGGSRAEAINHRELSAENPEDCDSVKTGFNSNVVPSVFKPERNPRLCPRDRVPAPISSTPHRFRSDVDKAGFKMYPGPLETFSPDGKQRENYPNTPPSACKPSRLPPQRRGLANNPGHDWKQVGGRPFALHPVRREHDPFPAPYGSWGLSRMGPEAGRIPLPQHHPRSFSVDDHLRFVAEPRPQGPSYRRSSQVSTLGPSPGGVAYENRTYEDSSSWFGRSARPQTRWPVDPASASRFRGCPETTRPLAQVLPPQCTAPHHHGPVSYDNPSYELKPIYYTGEGRYVFADSRVRPPLISSTPPNLTGLSWV